MERSSIGLHDTITISATNLGFKISTQNCKISVDIDEMLKDTDVIEGLSEKAKDLCQDRFNQSMAVNFVLQWQSTLYCYLTRLNRMTLITLTALE